MLLLLLNDFASLDCVQFLRGYNNQKINEKRSSGPEVVIDHNDYESKKNKKTNKKNQSKRDSAPAVWLFADIIRSVYFHQRGRKKGSGTQSVGGWGGVAIYYFCLFFFFFFFPSCLSWAFTGCSW